MIAGNGYYQGPAAGGGSVSLAAAAFTPTISGSSNLSSLTAHEGYASKVGKEVAFSGAIRASVTGAGACSVTIDLPYPPDNDDYIAGCGSYMGAIGGPYILTAQPTGSGEVRLLFTATSAEAAAEMAFCIQYKSAT
jgi:hypothetical protein